VRVSRARVIASLALAVLMIAAPLMALYNAPVASALQPNTTIKVYPYKIVKGQDVLFTVVQTGGAFTPGATLYVKVKNEDSWGTSDGYAWIGLPSGKSQIPKGSTFYLPADYNAPDLSGSNNLVPGKAYFLVSDSPDSSTGVTSAEVDVVTASEVPYVSIEEPVPEYLPSTILNVAYSSTDLPTFTVVNGSAARVVPGETLTIYYYVPGHTVYFYWDYYGGTLLASGTGGYGKVKVKIPDAPEGFHYIVAVSDTGYGAFNVVYVEPYIVPNHFSIEGKAGETVSFTGKGFPANSKLNASKVILTLKDGAHAPYNLSAVIVSGGQADSLGRISFTIKLLSNKPQTLKGGLVDVTLYYDYGDVDYVVNGQFKQGQLAPAGDGHDMFSNTLAVSTPSYYGDEVMIISTLPSPTITLETEVGKQIPVAVVNFPAYTKVDIYIGPKIAGTLVTDDKGAAFGYVTVPELPGYTNSGTQVTYIVRAMAYDSASHGTLVGVAADGTEYTLKINWSAIYSWDPLGYKHNYDFYLASGLHTITVELYGLAPFARVDLAEVLGGVEAVPLAHYVNVYNVKILEGSLGAGYFVANANGALVVQYTTAYTEFYEGSTGDPATIEVNVTTATGYTLLSNEHVWTYLMIFPGSGQIVSLVTSPANLTLETLVGFTVVHPGDYLEVSFSGLVPGVCYTLSLNGQPIQMYSTNDIPIPCAKADDNGQITFRFTVPDSRSIIGINDLSPVFYEGVLKGQTAADLLFIASSPREDLYGTAKVLVYPTKVHPGDYVDIIGVNFESGEGLEGGFSTIGTVGTTTADQHGAAAFYIQVPDLPAGTYTVYIRRTVTYQTFTATVEVVPDASLTPDKAVPGQVASIDAIGLEPNKAYVVYWSESPDELGEPITNTGIPGLGTPLTWFSDPEGHLHIDFEVPSGVMYKVYYVSVFPADNVAPDARVAGPFPILILPGPYFSLEEAPYVIPGQVFTVDFNFTKALEHGALAELFPGFYNASQEPGDAQDFMNMLASMGRAYAIITMPDGSTDVVSATMQPLDNGYLRVSFVVPNAKESEAGVIGLKIMFTLTYVPAIWNTSSEYDYPLYNAKSVVFDVGGMELMPGGGLALASISGQLATVVETVDNAVDVITTTVSELKPVILAINDTVVYMNTTLGLMKAQLDDIESLINGSTVKILQKGDEVIAEVDTKSGEVLASLDSLAKLVNDAYVEITGNQATIITDLGEINTTLTDLARMVEELGNEVVIEIDSLNESLAHIIVSEGDQIVAQLSTLVNQLQPLIISLNGTVAQLQTTLGTMQADLKNLLAGQAEIEKLVVNQSGAVIAVVKTSAGELNATLAATLEMIKEGMATLSEQALAQLTSISNKIDTASSALSDKLDTVLASLKDVSSAVSSLSDKVDSVKGALDSVNTKLGTISSSLSSLSGKADDISKKLGDLSTSVSGISSKVATIQSNVADVKSTLTDVKSTVSSISGKVDNLQSSVNSLSKSVSDLSGKVDKATTESTAAKSRATVLGGTTAGLVIVNIIITALAMARKPE
jgi:archaellum component FlaC